MGRLQLFIASVCCFFLVACADDTAMPAEIRLADGGCRIIIPSDYREISNEENYKKFSSPLPDASSGLLPLTISVAKGVPTGKDYSERLGKVPDISIRRDTLDGIDYTEISKKNSNSRIVRVVVVEIGESEVILTGYLDGSWRRLFAECP